METEFLFEISRKLLELTSLAKANTLLRDHPVFEGVEDLQVRANDLWRELMKKDV